MSDDIKINQKQIDWYIRASGGKLDPNNSVLCKPPTKEEKSKMDNGVTELDKLCHAHQQAAEEEKKAKARRLEIEGLIVAISDVREEGSSVTKTRYYKCTCTGKLTRKLDQEAWENIRDDIPLELQPVKTKVDIDLPKLRAIESANPELFKLVCNAIATKPAKTSIKVEVLS